LIPLTESEQQFMGTLSFVVEDNKPEITKKQMAKVLRQYAKELEGKK